MGEVDNELGGGTKLSGIGGAVAAVGVAITGFGRRLIRVSATKPTSSTTAAITPNTSGAPLLLVSAPTAGILVPATGALDASGAGAASAAAAPTTKVCGSVRLTIFWLVS